MIHRKESICSRLEGMHLRRFQADIHQRVCIGLSLNTAFYIKCINFHHQRLNISCKQNDTLNTNSLQYQSLYHTNKQYIASMEQLSHNQMDSFLNICFHSFGRLYKGVLLLCKAISQHMCLIVNKY